MASLSQFYQLQKIANGDRMSLNDYAFSHSNIDTIDRVLEKHDNALFSGDSPIDDPTTPLSLEVETTGGNIPAGRTIRYKFTWVDASGAQTAASGESTITTPAPLARPAAPSVSPLSTGGTLLAGNYFYTLSAYVGANTLETTMGAPGYYTLLSGTTNRLVITLPTLPGGADGFNLYRRAPGETTYYYMESIDMQVATPPTEYVDAGAVVPSYSRSPTPTNLTFSQNKIILTVPGATPTVPDGYTWKVYRTFLNGQYESSLLEWVRTETENGSGIIVPETVDYGRSTMIGSPPTVSTITGDVNRMDVLEAAMDALQVAQIYKITEDIETDVDEPEDLGEIFTIPAESMLKFEAYVMVDAVAAQDLTLMFVPSDGTVSMRFSDNLSTDVYTEDVEYPIDGASPTVVGVSLHGVIDALDEETVTTINLWIAQSASPATPGASILKRGSWFRVVV